MNAAAPNPAAGMKVYEDGTYKKANPTWGRERAAWKADQVVRLLLEQQVKPSSILEIGCGTGLVLAGVGAGVGGDPTLVGLEPSSNAPIDPDVDRIAQIKRLMLHETTDKADLVMLLDVFEHVEDHIGMIRAAAERANKWIVFHIPIEVAVIEVASGRLGRSNETVSHLHYFSDRTALIALKAAGVGDVIGIRYTPSAFEGPTRDISTTLNRLRRLLFRFSPKLTARWLGGVSLAVLARTATE